MLHGIFVNSLSKTTNERFKEIKTKLTPLIKKLKDLFHNFDKNDVHNDYTYILPLNCHYCYYGTFYDRLYFINDKDYLNDVDNEREGSKDVKNLILDAFLYEENSDFKYKL